MVMATENRPTPWFMTNFLISDRGVCVWGRPSHFQILILIDCFFSDKRIKGFQR